MNFFCLIEKKLKKFSNWNIGIVKLAESETESDEEKERRNKAEALMNDIKVNLKYMPVEYQEKFKQKLKELNLDEDFNVIKTDDKTETESIKIEKIEL